MALVRKHRLSKRGQHPAQTPGYAQRFSEIGKDVVVQDFNGGEILRVGTLTEADYTDVRGISATTGATITLPGASTSDGTAPSTSPTPVVQGGPGYLAVTWSAITNHDPVTYNVYLDVTSGFTPSASNLVATVKGTIVFVRALNSGDLLAYDTAYYVKIVASDDDGSGPTGTEVGPTTLNPNGTNDILAGSITAEKLASVLVLASTIETADTGQRVQMDTDGIRLIASDDTVMVNLPTDSGQAAAFTGDIEIGTEVVHTHETLEGILTINAGAYEELLSYQADPTVAPTITQQTNTLTFNSASSEASHARRGLNWDGTYFGYLTGDLGNTQYYVRVDTTGTEVDRTAIVSTALTYWVGSICKIGSFWYAVAADSILSWHFLIWADASGVPSGSSPTVRSFSDWTGWFAPFATTDGTDLWVCQSDTTPTGGTTKAQVLRYTVSGTTAPSLVTNRLTSTAFAGADAIAGFVHSSADLGAARNIILTASSATIRSYDNTAGTVAAQTTENWHTDEAPVASTGPGLVWDGTNFWQMSQASKVLIKYAGVWSADNGTTAVTYYYAYTWADSNATGGTHESGLSPRQSVNRKSRRYITVSWSTIPTGGTNDPNRVNVYGKVTSTFTTIAGGFEQAMTKSGTHTQLTTYGTTAGTADTTFASLTGTPAYITSAVPTTHAVLKGSGDGFIPIGSISMFAGSSAPVGYLLCDGSAVSRTTYANLFGVISTTFGVGDGSTTFNLPNFVGMFPAGVNGSTPALGGTAAGGTHNSAGGHVHDGHGVAIPDHNVVTTRQGTSAGAVVTTGAHSGLHASDGAHTHNAHTFGTGVLPPYLGINFIVKT